MLDEGYNQNYFRDDENKSEGDGKFNQKQFKD